jgi:hypothetical protein
MHKMRREMAKWIDCLVPGKRAFKIFAEFLMFLTAFTLVVGSWYYFKGWVEENVVATPPDSNAQARGLFGDQFGAINALFSGLAFAGIILTILLQRRELSESRKASNYQRFENTFFQLIQLHIDIVSKLSMLQREGKEAFESLNERLKSLDKDFPVFCAIQKLSKPQIRDIKDTKVVSLELYPVLEKSDVANIEVALKVGTGSLENYLDEDLDMHELKIKSAYKSLAESHIDNFSHYFRNLYHILKYIAESKLIGEKEKKEYSKFVRSQLSEVELVAIFYNSITKVELAGRGDMELGYPKMTALIKRFDILQNMSPRSLIHPCHYEIYKNSGGSELCK